MSGTESIVVCVHSHGRNGPAYHPLHDAAGYASLHASGELAADASSARDSRITLG